MRVKVLAIFLIAGVGAAVLALFAGLGMKAGNLDDWLKTHGLGASFAGFKMIESQTQPIKGYSVIEGIARKGMSEIRVTVVPGASASYRRYVDQRLFQIQSQFNRGASPYPGAISEQTQCPPNFVPAMEDIRGAGWSGRWLQTNANSRMQFGVCDAKEKAFDAVNLILLCAGSGTIFDLTVFAQPGRAEIIQQLKSVTCAAAQSSYQIKRITPGFPASPALPPLPKPEAIGSAAPGV